MNNSNDEKLPSDIEKELTKDRGNQIKTTIILKQQVIFIAMLVSGCGLLFVGLIHLKEHIGNGIAFLLVGFAGLIMSWTTTDIGENLKASAQSNIEATRALTETLKEYAKDNHNTTKSIKETTASIKETMNLIREEAAKDRDQAAKDRDQAAIDRKETQKILKDFTESINRLVEKP